MTFALLRNLRIAPGKIKGFLALQGAILAHELDLFLITIVSLEISFEVEVAQAVIREVCNLKL